MGQRMKKLTRLADSRSNVKSFPAGVPDDIGYALYVAQLGEVSANTEVRDGTGAAAAPTVTPRGEVCRKEKLLNKNSVRAMYSPTSAWPMPTNT
jgi:hypothetical protein